MSDITVIIPVYDPYEIFENYIERALTSITEQILLPTEVLLSGPLKPSYLDSLFKIYGQTMSIRFIYNNSTSTSSNLNFLAKQSTSKITKILFQDDFLISKYVLRDISQKFRIQKKVWLVVASKNYDDFSRNYVRNIRPRFSKKIAEGINTIGSPSVIAFRTESFINFNEDLIWMLDCDWYLRMKHNYGRPIFLRKFGVANRLHDYQATHMAQTMHEIEVAATRSSHSIFRSCHFDRTKSCICQALSIDES